MSDRDYEMPEIPKNVAPPGNQTGVYYIPISNLPFNVSWQQIKDYVRQVCDVDHVEIFQKSTSGWVRVQGRDNFEAAFRHLNGKEFNGRAIIADGGNGESPILVRDLDVCKPTGTPSNRPSSGGGSTAAESAAPSRLTYATGASVSYPDSSTYSSSMSTTSSSFSQRAPEYQYLMSTPATHVLMMSRRFAQQQDDYSNLSMASSSFMGAPDTSFSHGHVAGGYDPLTMTTASTGAFPHSISFGFGPMQTAYPQAFMSAAYQMSSDGGAQTIYSPPTSYAVRPPVYNGYYPPTSTAYLTTQSSNMTIGTDGGDVGCGGGGGMIYTEQRGVHIRDISRRASEDQIKKMIREMTGPQAAAQIEAIKIPLQDGAPRGHAFVHFRSASLARRLADYLDGKDFKGRKLQARLMKEGDTISGSGRAGEDRRWTERKDRDRPEKSSRKASPLVVSGGTRPEKHGKRSSSLVIADGSLSSRRISDTR